MVSAEIADNEQGLAMAGHSTNFLPELQPNKELKVEVMKKKLSKELSARTADDSSTKADDMQVSPAIAKPRVGSSFLSRLKMKLYENIKTHIENNWFYYLAICVGFTFERIAELIVKAIANSMQ